LTPKSSPTVPTGQNATDGITVSADGKSVYVAGGNPNNDVLQYDVGAGGLLSAKNPPSVSAGNLPVGVAVLPEQGPVASFSATPGPPGTPTKFDGTSSTDANGPIGSYTWSFGDGTTATNAGATPSHTYAAPGTYQVTLTLTDANGCSTTIYMGQTDACNASSATLTRSVTITLPPVIAATTQPANGLTTATATLHGLVATDQAPVTWSFQYGPSKFYGKSTAAQTIPAGKKTMPLPVSSTVTHLKPLTVYHFRLVASTQAAGGQTVTSYGRDMTFTTKPTGTLQFSLSKLRVLGGLITLPLKCASNVPCSGRLTITTKTGKHKKTRTLQCVAVSFKLKAKSKKSLEARVSHACMSLLSAGHGHRINARLASQSATGQRTPNKNVILTL
jgi:PKD repeat protein